MTTHTEFEGEAHDAKALAAFLEKVRLFCIGRGVRFDEVHISTHEAKDRRSAPGKVRLVREVLTDKSEVYNVEVYG